MLHKYGGTFTQLADECIDEFVTDYMKHAEEEAKLDEQMRLFPKLKPICDDDVVRDHMNIWIDKYLEKNGKKYALKGHTDPPTDKKMSDKWKVVHNYSCPFDVLGQAFTEGKTQGDVTRKLEVCSHHYPSYGSYLRNKDLAEESCASDNA
ncbi:unnamed protein product [Hydatigera taeniaeformis]|uniref:SCP domain-containing protein n=1 Tax=Hydatigena taeniaeformis TaxID=6205 RepID=A0A0R3WMS8_HYDTA|nr:unnamed protein product [Hydatigera taeniaeformis]